MLLRVLLVCGILSQLLYAVMNVIAPLLFEGYSVASQTVSELSAIGAPTRPLWVCLGSVYSLLVVAFGWGVWKSAGPSRLRRAVGGLMIVDGIFVLFWPPMHLRGAEITLTDTLHIVWTGVHGLLVMLAMGFGAAALGRRFGLYSIATIAIIVVSVALTAMDAPRIQANLPTPWVGVWERISVAAFMLWVVVLALALLRKSSQATGSGGS